MDPRRREVGGSKWIGVIGGEADRSAGCRVGLVGSQGVLSIHGYRGQGGYK